MSMERNLMVAGFGGQGMLLKKTLSALYQISRGGSF